MIVGLVCAVCRAAVDIATPLAFKCPNATSSDPHHVLQLIDDSALAVTIDHPVSFVRYGPRLAWWAFARANGLSEADCISLTLELAGDCGGTPFDRSAHLSDALDLNVWVKDETVNVAGSHKARHLLSILLHLRAMEMLGIFTDRAPLAIASCGNAALAAATLAARSAWPLDVFVPTWMDDSVGAQLSGLGARVHRCERRSDDVAGDPAMLRFRDAVDAGAIPFTVQGPENALCLDGGRTIGWEISDAAAERGLKLNRAVIQVGGGAFAACVGTGLGNSVPITMMQAEGCAPLAQAWSRRHEQPTEPGDWSNIMQVWPDPQSLATGILDDETYDWIADFAVMENSDGGTVVASESDIEHAHQLASAAGYNVSPTGSAGLAGLIAIGAAVPRGAQVAVVMSGIAG